ncbi:MAG TPA: translocation/assembly module TamB domain-containing protein [Vicinamibacterales bacterium]|nr:translocation/assembly module TamB domain-containing protein [Vicinamibacterales bacterium]
MLVGIVVVILILVGLGIAAVETGWAKNRIRDLIVRQANNYLTATLSIGRLGGSLFRGLQLGDVTVARDGRTLIHIDEISLSYSIRELIDRGTAIRRVRLVRPHVEGARLRDGRWDLGALVKRESREEERTGPGRPISIQSIEIDDGRVLLHDPLDFGAAHVPTDFQQLNAAFSFTYVPVRWTLDFARISWVGHAPELSVNPLSGRFGRGPTGWFFEEFLVRTARSQFTLDGTIKPVREGVPTVLDLRVRAPRFAFQEWSGVLRGLQNIAIESSFETSLKGPTNGIETDLKLAGTGGGVTGHLTLDTSVPGWHGKGAVDIDRLNLARWMNREDRPSDITGHVTFDLALELGRHFPRGVYTFAGRHAMYMDYGGDDVRARGQITSAAVLIAQASATAYGADVTLRGGSINLDEPFQYHFEGTTTAIDLRRLPATVPVPHVESLLAFDYDVTGTFSQPYIVGHATFSESHFLDATVGPGTVGSIDTQQKPFRYTGEGDVSRIDLHRFGEGLDVGWLRDPRYEGVLSGHFRVDGAGSGAEELVLTGGGQITRANLFNGTLSNADVSVAIDRGSLRASYEGSLEHIDPAIPFADPRYAASLTGTGKFSVAVQDLLTRTTALADYDVEGTLSAADAEVRGYHVDRGRVDATLRDSTLAIAALQFAGPALEGQGTGTIALSEGGTSDFSYELTRADLAALRAQTGRDIHGAISTKGRVTGPASTLHAVGDATIARLEAFDVSALSTAVHYDATIPANDPAQASVRVEGHGDFLTILGQSVQEISGTTTYDAERLGFDLRVAQQEGRRGQLTGAVMLHSDRRQASILDLTVTLGSAPWQLQSAASPAGNGTGSGHSAPTVSWSDDGFAITPIEFADANRAQRIGVSGSWRRDGAGALHITADRVFLETMQTAFERPTRYGGAVNADVTISGTRDLPQATGTITIENGRVERVTYQRLQTRFSSSGQVFDLEARLDQSPGVWLTAAGKLPLGLFNHDLEDKPIDLTIKSSTIDLGLIEGLTNVVQHVSGKARLDVKAVGTSRDPHAEGAIEITDAAFLVTSSRTAYKNVRAQFGLATDKIAVEVLHIEDTDGHPLDVHGSLGTHELRVGDVEIEATARRFEVMRNELGRVTVNATMRVSGRFEAPRITGDLAIEAGTLHVDEILQRTLFQPYSTEETPIAEVDALAVLNPWQRLGLDLALHVPGTLHLTGENVQVSSGTPIGLGDINLRVTGDLYLYKDAGEPLSVTGSFDSIAGTYAFQGRRFDVVPSSSINFRGDLNPDIYVTVTRIIQGVETRVSVFGPMRQPELRLASTPPLDESDVLALIIFNTSTNQLSAPQQQELLVRAGTLAAGFLAGQVLSAVQKEVGLDILELETSGDYGIGPKLTVGQEIAPGIVARFSRQFGQEPYDEATVEYTISRILRLRATYSDAQSLSLRAPFRRIERTGIDLLFFFSF